MRPSVALAYTASRPLSFRGEALTVCGVPPSQSSQCPVMLFDSCFILEEARVVKRVCDFSQGNQQLSWNSAVTLFQARYTGLATQTLWRMKLQH